MHRGRIPGAILGLVILAAAFLVPFFTSYPGPLGGSSSLYGETSNIASNFASVQKLSAQGVAFAYAFIVAAILIFLAGILGYFPLGSAVLGIIGMAIVTASPYVLFGGLDASTLGLGFYIIWIVSVLEIVSAFLLRRLGQKVAPGEPVPQAIAPAKP